MGRPHAVRVRTDSPRRCPTSRSSGFEAGAGGGLDHPVAAPVAGRGARLDERHDAAAEAAAGEPGAVHARGGDEPVDERIDHRGRHLEVVAEAGVGLDHEGPAAWRHRRPGGRRRTGSTRAFSVTTWRARARTTGSSMAPRSSREASRSGPTICCGRLAAVRVARRRPTSPARGPGRSARRRPTTSDGSGTGSTASVRKSISRAWPATPASEVSWSMTPHGTPDATLLGRVGTAAAIAVGEPVERRGRTPRPARARRSTTGRCRPGWWSRLSPSKPRVLVRAQRTTPAT